MKNIYQSLLLLLLLVFASGVSYAQVPVYNSYVTGNPVPTIFLDFDGQTVSGTQWNSVGTIAAGPSNLTTAQITEIYDRIAEDYRPFTVNVTTDSTKYFAAPAKQRMRVIFTISHQWYSQPVGGVSYINSFAWGDNTPCWVFTAALQYNTKNISEAGAHEAGHTLGLRHQASYDANCTKLTDYNAGTGTGEIGWAPIMGVGYSKNFTTWNLGPNSLGCSTMQSDMSVITKAANGITYRSDDYAESFTAAAATPLVNNSFDIAGVIAKSDDKDMFKFVVTEPSRFQLTAVPYNVGSNNSGSDLDMQVQLFDAAQTVAGSYNPAPLLSSVIDTTLTPGTYYLLVDGKGNQFASEYGSLGSYAMQGDITPYRVLPLHKLELKGINNNGLHQLAWEIVADETVTKQVVEVSSNGSNFQPLNEVGNNGRSYGYYPNATAILQYRLNVTFDNGRQYYSNIISLRNYQSAQKPQLVSNLIRSNSLQVTSAISYNYSVTDLSGRQLKQGQITEGASTITFNTLVKGTFLIRFSNESEQFVEKFVKQ
ncbi:MAG: hypothetical protein JWP88_1473 [Flaviaesturariibacter sp.]|nr:hypothetical protein [Flaviaesturariibacter sp.]